MIDSKVISAFDLTGLVLFMVIQKCYPADLDVGLNPASSSFLNFCTAFNLGHPPTQWDC